MDYRTAEARSALMARIRSKNTGPERMIRRTVYRMGYRFRLHSPRLPGRPDLVFPSARKAIFVHGCFWHLHGCPTGRLPKSRLEFWGPKLEANTARDRRNQEGLATLGWSVLVVWQCEVRSPEKLTRKLEQFLGGGPSCCDQHGREAMRRRTSHAPK